MHPDCIFCAINTGNIPTNIVAENDHVFVIKDIAPKAPIHYLIITKNHYSDLNALPTHINAPIANACFSMAQHLSQNIHHNSHYRLINNNGAGVGQSVFHFHMHFLAGTHMHDF